MVRIVTLAAFVVTLSTALPTNGQCPPGTPDDTAALQAKVDGAADATLEPRSYCVNALKSVRLSGERRINFNGAQVGVFPGCVNTCRAFETVPGAKVELYGPGTITGDLSPAVGWSIGFRCDSAACEVAGLTFRSWRTDGIWAGGNSGASLTVRGVTVEDFGRNGLSIVNGTRFRVYESTFRGARPGSNPGAGIDVEPNPGDKVTDLVIMDSLAENCVVGFYLHAGRGLQGEHFTLTRSEARNNTKYGVILNSTAHAEITHNYVLAPPPVTGQPVPVGISVGASGPIMTNYVTITDNTVEGTTRPLVLAGVSDPMVCNNKLVGGSMQMVAPSATVPAVAGVQFYVP